MRSTLRAGTESFFVPGAAGRIETVLDLPDHGAAPRGAPEGPRGASGGSQSAPGESRGAAQGLRGIALVAHPHPLFGGTLDNKVAQTLAKTFADLGYAALRSNFRGVGGTEGAHDHGTGEVEDLLVLAAYARERFGALPVALAGYSFGAWVQTRVAERMDAERTRAERLLLIGLPAGFVSDGRRYDTGTVPPDTLVIHGEKDDTAPLANVFDWARPQDLPVTVIPGADHFFHRKLALIRAVIKGQWR